MSRQFKKWVGKFGLVLSGLGVMGGAQAELACNDAGVLGPDMISNVCWDCMFPIRVAGIPLNGSNSGAPAGHASDPICACPDSLGIPSPGVTLSMWEPARLVELQRTPGCLSSMGGTRLPFDQQFRGTHGETSREVQTQFMHYHYFTFPLFAMLDMFSLSPCSDGHTEFDVLYLSELDPTWNSDELAAVTHPEALAVADVPQQLACSADAVSSTAGEPIDSMHWCAGSWGSMYPYTGNVHTSNTIENTSLQKARVLGTLHRRGLAKKTMGNGALCGPTTTANVPKSQYKFNTFYYNAETSSSHAFGESPIGWGAGRFIPEKDDPVYMVWRWNDCCSSFGFGGGPAPLPGGDYEDIDICADHYIDCPGDIPTIDMPVFEEVGCYDPESVGKIGTGDVCKGMLIVDREMLLDATLLRGDYSIYHEDSDITFTLYNDSYNVFTGQVTDMRGLFRRTDFNGSISYWDTSNVTRMDSMFSNAANFNQPLNWDTSRVTSMSDMFSGATSFNRPLYWLTHNVTDMGGMFRNAVRFNQGLSWDVSNVRNMLHMFSGAASMNGNLRHWDVRHLRRPSGFDSRANNWSKFRKPCWEGDCDDEEDDDN